MPAFVLVAMYRKFTFMNRCFQKFPAYSYLAYVILVFAVLASPYFVVDFLARILQEC